MTVTVGLNKLQILKIHAVSRKIFLSESTSSAVETEKNQQLIINNNYNNWFYLQQNMLKASTAKQQ